MWETAHCDGVSGPERGPGAAPGCNLYSDGSVIFLVPEFFAPGSAAISKTIANPIPYNPALAGLALFSQVGAFSPLNAAGIISSNGVSFTTGL